MALTTKAFQDSPQPPRNSQADADALAKLVRRHPHGPHGQCDRCRRSPYLVYQWSIRYRLRFH